MEENILNESLLYSYCDFVELFPYMYIFKIAWSICEIGLVLAQQLVIMNGLVLLKAVTSSKDYRYPIWVINNLIYVFIWKQQHIKWWTKNKSIQNKN